MEGRLTEEDWVSWEDGEFGVEFVEELELVDCAADAGCEEEDIALEP